MIIRDGIAIDLEKDDFQIDEKTKEVKLVIPEDVVKIGWSAIASKYPTIKFARIEYPTDEPESSILDSEEWLKGQNYTYYNGIRNFVKSAELGEVSSTIYEDTIAWMDSLKAPCNYEAKGAEPEELLLKKLRLVNTLNRLYEFENMTGVSDWDKVEYRGDQVELHNARIRAKNDIQKLKKDIRDIASTLRYHKGLGNLIQATSSVECKGDLVEICPYAFSEFKGLTSFVMPDSVKQIGFSAFEDCEKLKDVVISRRLEVIPKNAFYRCDIEHLILPDSVRIIKDHAFAGCPIDNLYLSRNLETIEPYAFGDHDYEREGGRHMHEVVWAPKVSLKAAYNNRASYANSYSFRPIDKLILPEHYSENVGITACLSKNGKAIFRSKADRKRFCKGFSDESFLKSNSDSDHEKLDTTHVRTMEEAQRIRDEKKPNPKISGVQVVGEYAYAQNQSIVHVWIDEGVKVIARGAFAFCPNLEKVILPESLEYIDDYAFIGCPKLREIIRIPDEKKSEKERQQENKARAANTFEVDYTGTKKKDERDYRPQLPKKVTGIGDFAFSKCPALKHIVCLGDIEQVGKGAFADSGLTEAIFKGDLMQIGDFAFYSNPDMTDISIQGKTTSIGERSFAECSSLTDFDFKKGLTTIGEAAFGKCKSLSNAGMLDIPQTVTDIGAGAFAFCESLSGVSIPPVKEIKTQTFLGCTGLMDVKLSNGTEKIEKAAFRKCDSLGKMTFPRTIEGIGALAFSDCTTLALIEAYGKIPREADTFKGCRKIEETDLNTLVAQINDNNFSNGIEYEDDVATGKGKFSLRSLFGKKDKEVDPR